MAALKLSRPVHHDGKTYESLEIDEPTIAGIEAYQKAEKAGDPEITCMVALLAADSGLPADAIRKIRSSDLVRIGEAIKPFMEAQASDGSGRTGEASAQT
jgi:hypothetical protein